MANEDIRHRIVLDGEKEYNAAIKEAQRNLRVLRSELKAETAELGKNASEQQKAEVKRKNLQKQIKEQEKVVKTYEEALKEVREKYGENEEAVAKWEIKLNQARATLAGLKDGLTDTGNSMKSVATDINTGITAANSLADSFSKLGELGASVSSSIEGLFFGLIDNIHTAVSAIWSELMDVAAKSDNYLDLASYFGATASEVQKWDRAMKSANGSIETVTSLITKLKYSGKEKNVAEWFGVSSENYENDLEYFQAVMTQMYNMREEMKRAGTWDTAMADIFGNKKGVDVEGILSDWADITAGLSKFNAEDGGFGLSEEDIKKMGDLAVQVSTLKESWKALQEMAVVHLFGDLALNVTGNLQNIVDAFKEYFDADTDEGRAAALEKVKTNIEEMFMAISEAVTQGIAVLGEVANNLKNSEDPMVRAFGEFLEKIHDMLSWAMDPANWDTIKKGFEAIIGVWAAGKITSALGNLASFVSHIMTIRNGGKLFGEKDGSPTTTGGDTGGSGGSGWGGIGAAVGFILKKALPVAAGVGLVVADSLNNHGSNDINYDEFLKMAQDGDYYAKSVTDALFSRYGLSINDLKSKNELGEALGYGWKTEDDLFSILEGMYGWTPANTSAITASQKEATEAFWDAWRNFNTNGDDAAFDSAWEEFEKAFNGNDGTFAVLNEALQKLWEELDANGIDQSEVEDLPADWWNTLINKDQITAEDLSGFREVPGQMEQAVRAGVSGIQISMDGYSVARVVAPYVSEMIARDIPY